MEIFLKDQKGSEKKKEKHFQYGRKKPKKGKN